MHVNVACVQFHPVLGQLDLNLAKIQANVQQVMAEQPLTSLIVFPELATSGYECAERFHDLAQVAGRGHLFDFMGQLAKKHGIYLVFGFPERQAGTSSVLYNAAALMGKRGELIGVYRKVHLFDTEKKYFKAGDDYPVFDTDIGRLGIMICWDTAFPEVARTYALKGCELVIIPTNWEKPYQDDWDLITRARAFDNVIYIASANRVGPDLTLDWFGRSNIIDPLGKPIAQLDEEVEGYIAATLDFDRLRQLRESYYTFFKDRRPDTYGAVTASGPSGHKGNQ
jgi:predicted amidohydrolase